MLVTGFILYFMYIRVEHFGICDTNPTDPSCSTTSAMTSTTTASTIASTTASTTPSTTIPSYTCPPPPPVIPVSIISRYFGVGFNIDLVDNSSSVPKYVIEHIPTTQGTLGGVYSISSDGLFTIKTRNDIDPTQWWTITKVADTTATTPYYSIQPYKASSFALQYENGNLAIRLYTSPGFEGQKWLLSQDKITRGIPVLNYSPGSLFTAEFDPYSTTNSITNNNLNSQNSQQVSDVVSAVKSGIQQYLSQMNNTNPTGQLSASSLGNKEMPLNVNLNLRGSGVSGVSGVSKFANIDGSSSNEDIINLLDRYDSNINNGGNMLYTANDLSKQLAFNNKCNTSFNDSTSTNITNANDTKVFDINDYTSNRVGSCNCKL